MKTKLHSYRFDTSEPSQKEAYRELCRTLQMDRHFFNVIEMNDHYGKNKIEDGEVELEIQFLFSDQWNTSQKSPKNPNYRVFDWYEPIYPNRHIKAGYYLDITAEMKAIRENTLVCGYCGHLYRDGKPGFCTACLDSPHLKPTDFYLLRLLPVADRHAHRKALTEKERAELMPEYVHQQTQAKGSRAVARIAKLRIDLKKEYESSICKAEVKYKGFLWLMDHGIETENCIYYDHTGVFNFGWREPITSAEVQDTLRRLLTDFPYPYVFQTERKY